MAIPEYLFQMGGVVPVSPIRNVNPGPDLTPLISAAAIPVDSGISTALQVDTLALQRRNMVLQEERFEWQKESWREDMDFRKQAQQAQQGLQLMKVYQDAMKFNTPTGVSRQGSQMTGLPTTFHTPAQMKESQDNQKRRLQLGEEFIKANNGQIGKNSPALLAKLYKDLTGAEKESYHKAMSQAGHHENQMKIYKENADDSDMALMNYNMYKYQNSTNLDDRFTFAWPSLNKIAADTHEQVKKIYGQPIMVNIPGGGGAQQLVQTNYDMREAFSGMLINNYEHVLRERYEMEKFKLDQLREQGQEVADIQPYGEWVQDHVGAIADNYLPRDVKSLPGSHIADPEDSSSGSGGGDAAQANYGVSISAPGQTTNVGDRFDIDLATTKTWGGVPNPLYKPAKQGETALTDVQIKDFENLHRAVNGEDAPFDLTQYTDENGVLNKQGVDLLRAYNTKAAKELNQGLIIHSFDDSKKNGIFNAEDTSEKVLKQIAVDRGHLIAMDLQTGDFVTGEELLKLYAVDDLTGTQAIEKYGKVSGTYDTRSILSLTALKGNHQIADISKIGAAPIAFDMETPERGLKRYAVMRSDSWLNSRPDIVSEHRLYADALMGLGTGVEVNGDDLKNLLRNQRTIKTHSDGSQTNDPMTIDEMDLIANNTGKMRSLERGAYTHIEVDYGDSSSEIADARVQVIEPGLMGDGLVLADKIGRALGNKHQFELVQGVDPKTNQRGWSLSVDGRDGKFIPHPTDQNKAFIATEQIKAAIRDAWGQVPVESATPTSPLPANDPSGLSVPEREAPQPSVIEPREHSSVPPISTNDPSMLDTSPRRDAISGVGDAFRRPEVVESLPARDNTGVNQPIPPNIRREDIDPLYKEIYSDKHDVKPGGRIDVKHLYQNAVFAPDTDMNLSKQFHYDWLKHMDSVLPAGYKITSGFRTQKNDTGKGKSIDLTGKDKILNKWFKDNVPGLKKSHGHDVKYYDIPNTPFRVAYHQNWIKDQVDANGNIISWKLGTGHHYDIKYKKNKS